MLPGRAPFHKYVSNSEYFKYINIGIKILKGRKYCKEVILQQCRGIRAPLAIKSKMGFSRGIAQAVIKEAGVTVFK